MSNPSRLRVTAGEVANAVEGQLLSGEPGVEVGTVSIDSRSVAPGDLFFAIHGDRFDGHRFVPDALSQGACGVVVSEVSPDRATAACERGATVIRVADTIRALQLLARYVRRAVQVPVVAVTGSTGKTSTKEIAADFLATRYRVVRNRGNLNNHIGLPLSLLEMRQRPDVAVVELGMSAPGEIRRLVGIAEPEVRVWTNVAEAHSAFFETIDQIADAKAEILERATADDKLIANANDRHVMTRVQRFPGRVMTFGVEVAADVVASDVHDLGLDGTRTLVRTPAGDTDLRVPLVGRGQLANVLAALAVALQFQVPLTAIRAQVAALRPQPHRGEIARLRHGITLVDDSYNSNPLALACMLEAIGREVRHRRRLAVLGEMLELGDRSTGLHRACGRLVADHGIDLLVTIGYEYAPVFGEAAIAAGLPAASVHHVATSDEAAECLLPLVEPGDLVLVKGSRRSRTEVVVDRLIRELA